MQGDFFMRLVKMEEKPGRMFSKEFAKRFGSLYGPTCTFIANEDDTEWPNEKKNVAKEMILNGKWTFDHTKETLI
jgi:hypothetical protein